MYDPSDRRIPCSVSLCPNGCVRLQFGIAIVHMPRAEFRSFVGAASSALAEIDEDEGRPSDPPTRSARF